MLDALKNNYYQGAYSQAYSKFTNLISDKTVEKYKLKSTLETYNFGDFKADFEKWLKQGRYVWFIGGNISKESATKIAEESMNQLALGPVPVLDAATVLQLPKGKSYLFEFPLADTTNPNSAILTYFQYGWTNCVKKKLMNVLISNAIKQPFFDDLRTRQQLGYTVMTQDYNIKNVIGQLFLV